MTDPVKQPLHYVDGEFRSGIEGHTFETLNPSTNKVITEVAEGREGDIDAAVMAARRAFDAGPWPRMSAKERAGYLIRIAEIMESSGDEVARLEVMDTGLPITQAKGQAARAAQNFRFFARVIQDLGGEAHEFGGEFLNYTIHKPVGVAGLITPWNTPLMLESWKIAPCLASGCTAVLKPAEWSPITASKLAEMIAEADLPPGVFNVVHGFGESAGAPLVTHPGVDLISFTGETTTGKTIIRNGADTLKRNSMELGGKSAVVVFAGRGPRAGSRCRGLRCLLLERGTLHRWLAAFGGGLDLRRFRGSDRPESCERAGRRSNRSVDGAGTADPSRALRARHGICRVRQERGAAGGRRRASRRHARGEFPAGDSDRGCRPHSPRLPRGNLRARVGGDPFLLDRGGDRAGKRRALRARRLCLERRPHQGAPGRSID